MKKDFDGVELDVSYGQSAEGDGEKTDLSLSRGSDFAKDKGNFTMSVAYSDQLEIAMIARDYANKRPAFATFEGQGIIREDEYYQALSEKGLFYVPSGDYLFDGGDFPAIPISQVSNTF